MKARKTLVTFLLGIVTCLSLTFGVVFALPSFKTTQTAKAETPTYTTKDVAMLGSVAGWYGNGNFQIRLTLGECDWANESDVETNPRSYNGNLSDLLSSLDFFNHIVVGGKTLAEWGCTSCYDNIYWLNISEPKYTIMIPLAMGSENMAVATAAGVGSNSRLTIKEGALIPSYAYLQGDTTATVYRAGCDFVTENADVAYGIKAVGKTEVIALDYVTGWDSNLGNAYLGVSLKGDDFLGDGNQTERCTEYYSSIYQTNRFNNKIMVDGESGKTEEYGLFNLGSNGKGYYSFVIRAKEEESESITIPAGTLFPSYAMKSLYDFNKNPVYIMYETQTDVTFYKQADGTWQRPYIETETAVSSVKVAGNESDNFTVFSLSNHDYLTSLDNYGGTATNTLPILSKVNFYNHILVNDVAIGTTSEACVNVWGNKGAFAIRTSAGLNATKITILKGCQFPSYAELSSGDKRIFVTTEDVTFVKNENGEWVKYVPEGDFDTKVELVQFGRATNVLNINLSVNDYPSPDGNNSATYNIGIDKDKILSLNLFDNIIIDGYSLRSKYSNHGVPTTSEPWMWINKFVGHNFAVTVPSENGKGLTPNKITIRAGAQFPSMAYINDGTGAYYVTTEEVTYVRVSDNVESFWDKQAKITFKADGETVAKLTYTKTNGIEGEIPEVPEKEGYKGAWESYTLDGNDIVVNAVYTKKTYESISTSVTQIEVPHGDAQYPMDNFLIIHLYNHDYPSGLDNWNGGSLNINDFLANSNFYECVFINDAPITKSTETFLNIWGRKGAFGHRTSMLTADVTKVTILAGCEFPTYATLTGTASTAYVTTSDVTFVKEGDVWVKQASEGDESSSLKPTYDNEYVLSDLCHTSLAESQVLGKGHLTVNNSTAGTVYGYNASNSFSLTFDLLFNVEHNDFAGSKEYITFNVAMSTRGYSSSFGLGWRFYIYRPNNAVNKCVQIFCDESSYKAATDSDGNIIAYEQEGLFVKGQTYRVTLGYRLLDEATGTIEIYTNVNGWEMIETSELGADYIKFARCADGIAFTTNSTIGNDIRVSNPGFTTEKGERPTVTLQNDGKAIASESAWKYVLPELNPYDCGKPNEVFIGWTTTDISKNLYPADLYPAGYEYELTADTTFTAIWLKMSMQNGAAVRTFGQSGIRFLVDIDSEFNKYYGEDKLIKEVGTLIVPTTYLNDGREFVHESFPEGYYIDVPTETWTVQSGDTWTYVAALVNISPSQYAREMSARGYLKIAYTSGVGYVYTAYSKDLNSRSIYSVATSAINDKKGTETIFGYVNSVADITIDKSYNVTKTEGSLGGYDFTTTKDGDNYTVTFDKGVKAVMINGIRVLAGYEAEIIVGDSAHKISNLKLSSNGLTLTFTVESDGDSSAYYKEIAQYYRNSNEYTSFHKEKINDILKEWNEDYSNDENNNSFVSELERIKTQTELQKNVGATKLATPVVNYGLGYSVTWEMVENADYYLVTDDNDYRDVIYVTENSYKPEVVGKHNVTVTAYSYYEEFSRSDASASFATIEVKPVFTYKAMTDGLYKFSEDQMVTMGIVASKDELNTENNGNNYYRDPDAKKYFAYYNKKTGWSKNQGYATDWTSPQEFPAHAAKLKAMGNNVLLIAEDTAASFKTDSVWETSRTKYVMDTAWSMGLKVLVCDDVLYKQSKAVASKSKAQEVINGRMQLLEKYVSHPAFYGFSLEDEPEPNSLFTGSEMESVGFMIQALKETCVNLGYSKAMGNEPFFLACLYQYSSGFEAGSLFNMYKGYLEDWFDGTSLDYVYVDLYTGHAMGDNTNRYEMTYDVIYGSGQNGIVGTDKKFYQVITAHTQDKNKTGYLTDQDLYMSMLYAAAHNVAGYSWFCYFPILAETAASMVGYDGNGYGNGLNNGAIVGHSYYDAAKTAGYQFELIQGVLNGYSLESRSDSANLLTTTLKKDGSTITMYVNADTIDMSASVTVTASGSACYLVGYNVVGENGEPYQVVSGSVTLQPGQAVICVA